MEPEISAAMYQREPSERNQIIQSLDKGLYLLEVVEQAAMPVSLQWLTDHLGWDKSSILRICNTLERRGYLLRDHSSKCYSLGIKIFGLYQSITNQIDIQRIVRPYLNRIVRETGETAHLSIVLERKVVFIDKAVSSLALSANIAIGNTQPLHCTSVGKVFLAFLPAEDLESYFPRELDRFTPGTITDPDELRADLARIRERGFAVDDEEYIEGMRCVGVPLLNNSAVPVGMSGVSAPSFRLTVERAMEHGRYLSSVAAEVSRFFGFHSGA